MHGRDDLSNVMPSDVGHCADVIEGGGVGLMVAVVVLMVMIGCR